MEKVHNMRTTATHKDRTFRKSPTTVQVQDTFNQVPRTYNKHVMLWSSAAGVFHMALPCFSWPLGSYIIGSSMYLSASYLQHVEIKCNKLQEHPKNRAVKNCQQVELQNHNNCENCCTHRPMSPHVSNCMQVTSNYLQMKTVDIKSKNSEMNITWTDITRHKESKTVATVKNLQNQCKLLQDSSTASANRTGPSDNGFLHSLCKQRWTDSFCCFLGGFCTENVYNKQQKWKQMKTTDAFKFKWCAIQFKWVATKFRWWAIHSFWLPAARLCTLGDSRVNLEAMKPILRATHTHDAASAKQSHR